MGQQWMPSAKEIFPRDFLATRATYCICQRWFRGTEGVHKSFSQNNLIPVDTRRKHLCRSTARAIPVVVSSYEGAV
jgi:uncharacterized protein YodC (DUF2158 family)